MSRRGPGSLVARAALLFGLTACLVTGSLGTYFFQTARASLEEHMDQLLVARVEHFRRVVADMRSIGDLTARPVLFETMLGAEADVLLFRRQATAPFIRVNPGDLPVPELTAVPIGRIATRRDVRDIRLPDDVPVHWIAVAARTAGDGDPIEIIAAHPMTREMRMIGSYRTRVILATVLAMAVSVLLSVLLLRRGLRPLRRLAAQAGQINPINLAVRFDEDRAPLELRMMTVAFNAMLDRLARGYLRLSQFSADLAHEIRTPIGALIGQTQVALNQPRQAEEYQETLEANLEELNRLRAIAENILFLARADHAEQAIERQAIDLPTELRKIAEYFEGPADESGLGFEVAAQGTAWANPSLCQRAIGNLVINAVRYGAWGTTIRLTGRQDAEGASIVVENQGAPIRPDQLDRLFDRFYRGDAARHRVTESNGLGLAIVKAIMTLHGGKAEVRCPVPGTIRFELRFPCAEPESGP